MAKSDLFKDAQAAGLVEDDASESDYTVAQLEGLLGSSAPAWEGSRSSDQPLTSADGHETLSQDDIDARQ
jgi:hypothetical protein